MLAALCLAAGGFHATVAADAFTLSWRHSIEKIEWRESYLIRDNRLFIADAAVRGSGAGMDPPEGARLEHGAWHYRPAQPWRESIVLSRSEFAGDYLLCTERRCAPLETWMAGAPAGVPAELSACRTERR
ncbi:hypothetical protein PIGHUM_00390 [Pigmentiphaga humi]|uniref:DUF1850 domain-containing protein n=1 Tax=Pigmentiphaga humi TaxID=2478468 RepID=A0A3P4AW95_9BURK|nr:DUF1850 domain-containing protein [Pigmentiphaga humi]VCU68339.1 hypothetical protein PIGHUM_00390 [Pigmentiphaga humi]